MGHIQVLSGFLTTPIQESVCSFHEKLVPGTVLQHLVLLNLQLLRGIQPVLLDIWGDVVVLSALPLVPETYALNDVAI